jgi:hypothetical protein
MDKCLNLSVIPQFGGTCWFNAILMIALYSQNTRKMVLRAAKYWDKSNTFLMILKSILVKYYKEPENVQSFFKKIKPEIILFKMLKKYNQDAIIDKFKYSLLFDSSNFAWFEIFIIKFFKLLKVNSLDIIYMNGNYYLNYDEEVNYYLDNTDNKIKVNNRHIYENSVIKKNRVTTNIKKNIKKVPDVIIVSHEDINEFVKIIYQPVMTNEEKELFNARNYDCKIKGVDTYDDIIYVNGYKYKLDACTLSNYNTYNRGIHAIAGITCNNKHYVYNGWQEGTTDPAFAYYGNSLTTTPCSLMRFDWDLKKDVEFCLNLNKCKLDRIRHQITNDDLCFSFGKINNVGRRMLVYVRVKKEELVTEDLENKLTVPKEINISNISNIINEMHDIKKMHILTIRKKLADFGIHLIDGYQYSREVLEGLLLDAFKQNYDVRQKIKQDYNKKKIEKKPLKKPEKKEETKDELIKQILYMYPTLKNLKSKTKSELKEILKGNYNFNKAKPKEKPKDIPKHKTKDELMSYLLRKLPKLNKTELEQLIKCAKKEHSTNF